MNPLTSPIYGITRAIFDAYFDAQRASLKVDIEKHDPSDDVLADRFRTAVERVQSESSPRVSSSGSAAPISPVTTSPSASVGKDK